MNQAEPITLKTAAKSMKAVQTKDNLKNFEILFKRIHDDLQENIITRDKNFLILSSLTLSTSQTLHHKYQGWKSGIELNFIRYCAIERKTRNYLMEKKTKLFE
ncbi:hypothetical protein NH340_JMT08252 [Sarcoptes scabiei]|nr:hypothetical protein NH340_JMT08252 [Sarcoptes scabiei]